MAERPVLTFVVVCRDRHEELEWCLPSLSVQRRSKVVLVDYGSHTAAVSRVGAGLGNVTVLRVEEQGPFSLPRGRNLGAELAHTPYLCFTEADVAFVPDFVERIERHLAPGRFFISEGSTGTYSTCVVPKEAWAKHRFDEDLRGYGRDDCDFYIRLAAEGVIGARMPNCWFEHYEPDPTLRRRMWGDVDRQLAENDAHLRRKYGIGGEGPVIFNREAIPMVTP